MGKGFNPPQVLENATDTTKLTIINTVSPLHMNEFRSESKFVSPICSLNPTKLA